MRKLSRKIPTFVPGSALASKRPELTLQGVERFPYALDELGRLGEQIPPPVPIGGFNSEKMLAERLRERFRFHGSDKSSQHRYHLVYGEILASLGVDRPLNILEIGIGSNDSGIVSNMGARGKPGASLRAFRDVAINSRIFGADLDRKVLFSEERIQTAWVDQMQPDSFLEMNQSFGDARYDLLIDDGLHAVSANLNTLMFGLSVLRKGGWIVIEDIWAHRVCWNTVYRLLPDALYQKQRVDCDEGCQLFLLRKKP